MSAEAFITKIEQFHILTKYREEHPFASFVFTINPTRLEQNCMHLQMQKRSVDSHWGRWFPFCIQIENINLHTITKTSIISCKGCQHFEEGPNNLKVAKPYIREFKGSEKETV